MGLKSRRAFSAASQAQVLQAAKAIQALLVHVDRPINMSLLRIPHRSVPEIAQYGVVQFQDKEKSLATVPKTVEQAFASVPFSRPEQAAFKCRLLLDLNMALAVELSHVADRALYVVYSDTYCSSGYVLFEAGRTIEAVIYGWEGDETLFEFGPGECRSTSQSLAQTQYWKYAALGINRHLNAEGSYGDYIEQFDYSSSAIQRYRLMSQKELVQELAPEAF